MAAKVSAAVSHALAQSKGFLPRAAQADLFKTRVEPPVQLPFLSHQSPVDSQKPDWKEHRLLPQHRDSYGVRPSDHPRGHLRILSWNRWRDLRSFERHVEDFQPNVVVMLNSDFRDWQSHFQANPKFQHLYALAAPPKGPAPVMALHKQLIGEGSELCWFAKTGTLIARLASRGMHTLRIVAMPLKEWGQCEEYRRVMMESSSVWGQEIPQIVVGDWAGAGNVTSDLHVRQFQLDSGHCKPASVFLPSGRAPLADFERGLEESEAIMLSTQPEGSVEFFVNKADVFSGPNGSEHEASGSRGTGMLVDAHLVYKEGSTEKALLERFEQKCFEYEERQKNIPSSLQHDAAAIQRVLDSVVPQQKQGEAFRKRPGGRPVPRKSK